MATAPETNLPLFYNDLMPLNSRDHAKWRAKQIESLKWLSGQHAIPLTVDEFVQTQRDYPIVFSSGENPVPLALMGLNEGVNVFVDENGKVTDPVYIPAYVRRYPFMLARLTPDAEELSLCFDPTAGVIGDFKEGEILFDDQGKPAPTVEGILNFCEQFEQAGARTQAFIEEIKKHDLLMEGEIAITDNSKPDQPFVYRGFQMINEEKLRELSGDVLSEWTKNGLLPLLHAHLFSLDLMRVIFGMQMGQGKVPQPTALNPADTPAS
ncbi:MAG: SapC family protein [Tsuneonella suprasediminis]|uniref:Multidrug transporter n=1 Tax=Tsuneonella suprasediminis TaxID=2306996 RepID=A0A419QZW3_9SPHN|nr:SapC family protein [Tsuneonella suprasediminis]RJX66768.1 multidrug transporter [Tsuneonella suprasediminis]UBS34728.1 SapC family protein [Altererythrobacter sp. N1]